MSAQPGQSPRSGSPVGQGGATLPSRTSASNLPSAVVEVRDEIAPSGPGLWQPTSYAEWESRERAKTFLVAWQEQMSHERSLRSFAAKAIFALIVVQVFATFGLVIAQGTGGLLIDKGILQVLIPSVLSEVFGLGFLVTKYLFSQPLRHGLDTLVNGSERASRPPQSSQRDL
jgi:hypothetical protein